MAGSPIRISLVLDNSKAVAGIKQTCAQAKEEFKKSFSEAGANMDATINESCSKMKQDMTKSFSEAGTAAKSAVETSNNVIQAILNDTEKTEKSKAASIAAIYRKQGDTMSDAMEKAWSHIERNSASGTKKVKKHFRGLSSDSKQQANKIKNNFSNSFNSITSLAKKLSAVIGSAVAIKKLVDFGKACIDLGSDLQEVQNVVDVTFPAMSEAVNNFAKEAQTAFGLSETMAKKYTGTFGSMAKAFGFTEEAAYEMGTTLTGLAGDVASFYNITQDEAYTKLKSVFSGETETLKDLGVVMTQSALDSYALANGYGKVTSKMTEAEKVALRYAFVQDQLSAAAGDFTRTSDSWANQVKVLSLKFDSLKASIGQGLINLFTPVIKLVNTLIGRLSVLADAFTSFTELITGGNASDNTLSSSIADAETLTDTVSGIGTAAEDSAKKMRSLAGFDDIQKLGDSSSGSVSSSSDASIDVSATTQVKNSLSGSEIDSSWLDGFIDKFDRLKESCIKLYDKGIKKIINFAWDELKSIYNDFLKPIAEWTIGDGLPRLVDIFTEITSNIDFTTLNDALSTMRTVLGEIVITTGDLIVSLGEKLAPVAVPIINGIIELIKMLADGISELWDYLNVNFIPALKTFIEEINIDYWVGKISTAVEATLTILNGLIDWIVGAWTGDWSRALEGIKEIFSGAWEIIKNTVSMHIDIIAGICQAVIGTLKEVFASGWEAIKGIFSGAWEGIKKVFSPIGTWFSNKWTAIKNAFSNVGTWFKNKFTSAYNGVKNAFGSIGSFFSNKWTAIKNTFSNVKSWFGDKFTSGFKAVQSAFSASKISKYFSNVWTAIKNIFANIPNWFKTKFETAWTAVKNVFSKGGEIFDGIKDGILDGLKSVINFLIDGINDVIAIPFNGLNSALGKLRDLELFGLTPFDFIPTISVPQIPKLAQGGFVKANTPQLAMIGDNRHQGEVVAPEDKMQAMADEAASKSLAAMEEYIAAMMAGFEAVVKAIKEKDTSVTIGDDDIGKANSRYERKKAVITGGTT